MRAAEMPINPNLTKALKLTNKSWNAHSVQATKDPFTRANKPWRYNAVSSGSFADVFPQVPDALVQTASWCVQSDFVANGEEAQKVGHVPLPVDKIGLGAFFDVAFDRTLVGRRQAFREGEPSSVASAPVLQWV